MKVRALTVGPIVGYTKKDAVRLWGRGEIYPIGDNYHRVFGIAQVQYSATKVVTQFFKMLPKFDCTGISDFKGLRPNTSYRYRVGFILAEVEPEEISKLRNTNLEWDDPKWHEFRTNPGDNTNISFFMGSCRYLSRKGFGDDRGDKTFRSAVEISKSAKIDLTLMMGDQIYADDYWKFDPDDEQYEFFKKYRTAFEQPNIRKLMSSVSTYMILDDHEIINNWNQQEYENDEEMRELFNVAMSAYHPYQLVHGPAFDPKASRQADNRPKKLWYDFDCGMATFFVMDTRTERFPDDNEMVSFEQMKALKRWLKKNISKPKFIVTSVPFFPDLKRNDEDKWSGYPEQRLEILNYIAKNSISKTTFLSGDIHSSGRATITCKQIPKFQIHQIISSAFWWPMSPGNGKRFRNKRSLGSINGNEFKVTESNYYTDSDNFLQVSLRNSNSIEIKAFGRKTKLLKSELISLT